MNARDLFRMCMQNLMRRKSRTFLTVLGVVVGACAIIIMISIGVGMKESQEKMLSEMGDLTIITVMPAGRAKTAAKLNRDAVKRFEGIRGVVLATPRMTVDGLNIKLYAGYGRRYVSGWATVIGMDESALAKLGYSLLDGNYPGKEGGVLAGQNFVYGFEDSKRPEGHNTIDLFESYNKETGEYGDPPDPYFDLFKAPLELVITAGEDDKAVCRRLTVSGRMKGDYGKGQETEDGLIICLDDLQKLIEEANRAAGKKNSRNPTYPSALVKAENISDVARVESEIKGMGFNTSSMESIRKPMEKDAQQKQMMLGGMGAISLLVAALGIMNTMIMSITERTREIGVMKALGCFVHDIKRLFLLEAGVIGLMGGIIGIVLSYVISVIMNLVGTATPPDSLEAAMVILTTPGSRLSVIPTWLIGFALVFSILIGLGSGYYPAKKAVAVPALEAIKHD